MRFFSASALVLLLVSSVFASGALKVQVGQTAPRFFLVRLDNDSKRTGLRDFADSARRAADSNWGKPVVLAFWTTTCVNCRAEMPRLQKWADSRDIAFLPMLVENTDPATGIAWLDGIGIKARGLHDRYQVAGQNYGVCDGRMCTVPALVAISPDGVVRLAKSGYVPSEPLEDDLDRALALGAFRGHTYAGVSPAATSAKAVPAGKAAPGAAVPPTKPTGPKDAKPAANPGAPAVPAPAAPAAPTPAAK